MSLTENVLKVIQWAEHRRIIPNSNSQTQLLKTMSELGELADAIIKRDKAKIIDGIGDVLVTLIIVADLEDLDLAQCLDAAYEDIKDRRGTLLANGTFVKREVGNVAAT